MADPSWEVMLGISDSTGSNASQAITDIPRGNNNISLIASFDRKGLSVRDMVALSG